MNQNGNINRKQKNATYAKWYCRSIYLHHLHVCYHAICFRFSMLQCYIILNHICYVLPLMVRPFITNWDAVKWPRRTCHPRCAKASQRAWLEEKAFCQIQVGDLVRSGGDFDLWPFWPKLILIENCRLIQIDSFGSKWSKIKMVNQFTHFVKTNQSSGPKHLKIQKPLHTMRGNCEVMRCQGWFGSEPFPLILRIYFT